jgi:hypothetical protein
MGMPVPLDVPEFEAFGPVFGTYLRGASAIAL